MYDTKSYLRVNKIFESVINVISSIGGFYKVLSAIFLILVWPVRDFEYYKKLINDNFSVCENPQDLENVFQYDPYHIKSKIFPSKKLR